MATRNTSHGLTHSPGKAKPSDRGRRVREDSQDDESTVTQSNPPNHGLPTHSAARFLWDVPKDTPLDALPELYERWRDDSEQLDLAGWSE